MIYVMRLFTDADNRFMGGRMIIYFMQNFYEPLTKLFWSEFVILLFVFIIHMIRFVRKKEEYWIAETLFVSNVLLAYSYELFPYSMYWVILLIALMAPWFKKMERKYNYNKKLVNENLDSSGSDATSENLLDYYDKLTIEQLELIENNVKLYKVSLKLDYLIILFPSVVFIICSILSSIHNM